MKSDLLFAPRDSIFEGMEALVEIERAHQQGGEH
jgi:hypothetical protein